MKDGEGVTEMYSRLALITNEIAGLGSEEMTEIHHQEDSKRLGWKI